LPRFSLDRRITVLMLVLSAVVVGGIALLGLPVELIPGGFTNPMLAVIVPWADAPPLEVEEKITLPLQEQLATVRGLDKIVSYSITRGSRVYLLYKPDTDMDVAYREVRDRVERARREFPDDVDEIFIRKEDASGIPVFVLGVAVEPEVANSYDLIQNDIVLPLERVDGVASVEGDSHRAGPGAVRRRRAESVRHGPGSGKRQLHAGQRRRPGRRTQAPPPLHRALPEPGGDREPPGLLHRPPGRRGRHQL
jgi:HAE1 family hydrophobic/amphiphilic exporter-1